VAEKRSLFDIIFKRPKPVGMTESLRMLNGYTPMFTTLGDMYNSDVVRAAVDAIARNAAKLKAKHVRRVNGNVTPLNSNLEYLLSVRPNPHMDAYTMWYKVVTQKYVKNNAFVWIDWDERGQLRALYPVNASTVEFVEAQGSVFVKFMFLGGQQLTVPYEDVIHLRRFFNNNDLYGESNHQALMPTLELINTTNEGVVNAVKSSATLRGLLKFSSMLKPEDIKKQRDAFVADYLDINNNGGVAATDSRFEYVPLANDPKLVDAKTMELVEDKVYKYFNVNASIVKSEYNEEQWNAFYESVIEPNAIELSLEITYKLFTKDEQKRGNEIIFEANRLQYASNETKIAVITTLIDRGMMSLNQGLEIFNLPPIPDGDKRIVSLNFVDASIANQYQLGQQGGAPNGNQPTDTQGTGVSQSSGVSDSSSGTGN